jgi:glycosyltransferase involved in cell wall biosynthesis
MIITTVSNSLEKNLGGQTKFIIDLVKKSSSKFTLIYLSKTNKIIESVISSIYCIIKSDVIHIVGLWSFYNQYINLLSLIFNKPVIISTLGMAEPWSLNQKSFKKKLALFLYQKYFLNNARAIHCTSKQEILNLQKIDIKNKLVLIPHGVEIYKNIKIKKKKILLFISRIHNKKGIFNLIKAFKLIKNKKWKLFILGFGDTNDVKILKKEIKSYKNIKFFGEVHGVEKYNYYKKALVTILPSYNENFGYVIPESLSFSTAVITTANTPWTFIEKKNFGWLVDTEIDALAKKLSIILNLRSNFFYQRGLNGFRYVKKYYDINKIYIKYFRLYKSTLKINK